MLWTTRHIISLFQKYNTKKAKYDLWHLSKVWTKLNYSILDTVL